MGPGNATGKEGDPRGEGHSQDDLRPGQVSPRLRPCPVHLLLYPHADTTPPTCCLRSPRCAPADVRREHSGGFSRVPPYMCPVMAQTSWVVSACWPAARLAHTWHERGRGPVLPRWGCQSVKLGLGAPLTPVGWALEMGVIRTLPKAPPLGNTRDPHPNPILAHAGIVLL